MAHAGLGSAQLLPRFLLPRLSWQTAPVQHNTIRALSMISANHSTPPRYIASTAERKTLHDRAQIRTTSRILESRAHHRAFHATARQQRDHHFDTLKFVQRLKEEGFTEAQSVAMMKVLSDVIEERLELSILYPRSYY